MRISAFLPSSQASPASPASQPSQASQPASQASQPGQPGIEASGLQAPMSAILLYGGSSLPLKAATERHRPDSPPSQPGSSPPLKAATGRHRPDSPPSQPGRPASQRAYQCQARQASRPPGIDSWGFRGSWLRGPSQPHRISRCLESSNRRGRRQRRQPVN